MSVVIFDTLEYVETLQDNGFSAEQSKALTNLQKKALDAVIDSQLASKGDLLAVKEELKADIHRLDKELAVVKWVSFATFAIVSFGLIKMLLAN